MEISSSKACQFPHDKASRVCVLVAFPASPCFQLYSKPKLTLTLVSIFSTQQSEYWTRHYTFFKNAKEPVNFLGGSSISTIIINAVVPLLVAYGKSRDDQRYVDRAVAILQQSPG